MPQVSLDNLDEELERLHARLLERGTPIGAATVDAEVFHAQDGMTRGWSEALDEYVQSQLHGPTSSSVDPSPTPIASTATGGPPEDATGLPASMLLGLSLEGLRRQARSAVD